MVTESEAVAAQSAAYARMSIAFDNLAATVKAKALGHFRRGGEETEFREWARRLAMDTCAPGLDEDLKALMFRRVDRAITEAIAETL